MEINTSLLKNFKQVNIWLKKLINTFMQMVKISAITTLFEIQEPNAPNYC
jgi:hypothetical protein